MRLSRTTPDTCDSAWNDRMLQTHKPKSQHWSYHTVRYVCPKTFSHLHTHQHRLAAYPKQYTVLPEDLLLSSNLNTDTAVLTQSSDAAAATCCRLQRHAMDLQQQGVRKRCQLLMLL